MPNRPSMGERVSKLTDTVQGSQAWSSIFRPGSIFRKGYTDSPRNRSYVIMNSVLYHLHPVKVKRHAVKVSYTLCLGGLSFFLFIVLTVTGIFLMFFYRPTTALAWQDISTLHTSVAFGLLVRNMHRWAAHLMVISVFLPMARVFYHGAYRPRPPPTTRVTRAPRPRLPPNRSRASRHTCSSAARRPRHGPAAKAWLSPTHHRRRPRSPRQPVRLPLRHHPWPPGPEDTRSAC